MKIAVVFPGYLSQSVGMIKQLYDESRTVQEYFEEASSCLNTNFVKICFASSDQEIARIQNAYPAVFLVSSALYAVLKESAIEPAILCGYNQGDFSAFHAAKTISFPDGIYLINKYATLYAEFLSENDMDAIQIEGLSSEIVEDICFKASNEVSKVFTALYENETSVIIAGYRDAVTRAKDFAIAHADVKITTVPVEIGLHSAIMQSVVEQFAPHLEKSDFKNAQVPIISSTSTQIITEGSAVKETIKNHLRLPVNWTRILEVLSLYDMIIQVGPGTALGHSIKKIYPQKYVITVNKRADFQELEQLIAQHKESV